VRFALKIAYDGSHFSGFAMQPDKKTVEGEILKRLLKTKIIESRKKNRFQYAARTDKNVSALGNVVALNARTNPAKVMCGMDNIWVVGYASVEENFNPRYAKCKIYRYYIKNSNIDLKKLEEAAKIFVGEHDFSSFARIDARNPVRRIDKIKIHADGVIKIDFYAPSFLWNQVRRMVAALIKVGAGLAEAGDIEDALNGKRINFGIAPAKNLVLLDVLYDDVHFETIIPDEIAIRKEIYKDAFDYLKYASHSRNVGNGDSME